MARYPHAEASSAAPRVPDESAKTAVVLRPKFGPAMTRSIGPLSSKKWEMPIWTQVAGVESTSIHGYFVESLVEIESVCSDGEVSGGQYGVDWIFCPRR